MKELTAVLTPVFVLVGLACLTLASAPLFRVRQNPHLKREGTLSSVENAHLEDPGRLYYQQWVQITDHAHVLYEFLHVSVRAPRRMSVRLRADLPAVVSVSKLESFSDGLFDRIADSYLSVKSPLKGVPFNRQAKLALIRQLVALRKHAPWAELSIRKGRAVLSVSRQLAEAPSPDVLSKAALFEKLDTSLVQLVQDWTDLSTPSSLVK